MALSPKANSSSRPPPTPLRVVQPSSLALDEPALDHHHRYEKVCMDRKLDWPPIPDFYMLKVHSLYRPDVLFRVASGT